MDYSSVNQRLILIFGGIWLLVNICVILWQSSFGLWRCHAARIVTTLLGLFFSSARRFPRRSHASRIWPSYPAR